MRTLQSIIALLGILSIIIGCLAMGAGCKKGAVDDPGGTAEGGTIDPTDASSLGKAYDASKAMPGSEKSGGGTRPTGCTDQGTD